MSYGLVLAFDTDDPQFVRGFEAGRVWTELERAVTEGHLPTEPVTVHAANAEMCLRMAESLKLTVEWKELDDMWAEVVFGR